MYALQLHSLSKTFPGRERAAIPPIDVRFLPGRVTGLVGPNGAGKTTLLRIIAGLLSPSTGRIAITHEERELDLATARADLDGFVKAGGGGNAFEMEAAQQRLMRMMAE